MVVAWDDNCFSVLLLEGMYCGQHWPSPFFAVKQLYCCRFDVPEFKGLVWANSGRFGTGSGPPRV